MLQEIKVSPSTIDNFWFYLKIYNEYFITHIKNISLIVYSIYILFVRLRDISSSLNLTVSHMYVHSQSQNLKFTNNSTRQ